jgi:hypothetical protein
LLVADPSEDLAAPAVGEVRARVLGSRVLEPFVVPFAPVDDLAVRVDDGDEVFAVGDRIFGGAVADGGVAVVPEDGFLVGLDGFGFVGGRVAEGEIGRMRDLRMGGPADDGAEDVQHRDGAGWLGPLADGVRIDGWMDEWMSGLFAVGRSYAFGGVPAGIGIGNSYLRRYFRGGRTFRKGYWCFADPFPLTPALSLWEREKRRLVPGRVYSFDAVRVVNVGWLEGGVALETSPKFGDGGVAGTGRFARERRIDHIIVLAGVEGLGVAAGAFAHGGDNKAAKLVDEFGFLLDGEVGGGGFEEGVEELELEERFRG